jgi:hypothetical protein
LRLANPGAPRFRPLEHHFANVAPHANQDSQNLS